MLANRISFLSFLFILFFSPFIQSSDYLSIDKDHAQEWSSLYLEHMKPEEIQILANFLYLLYANGLIDTEIQKYYTPLTKLSQIARNNLSDPSNLNNELIQLNALTAKLSLLVKARFLYTKMLHECFNNLNENKVDHIEKALKDLQSHASNMLYSWATDNTQDFNTHLEKSAKTISECEKSMTFASNLHKSLSAGILPFVVEDNDKPLTTINVVLQTAPTFMNTADTATNVLNSLCNRAMETICFGAEIYKHHYQAVYNVMMQDSFDKNFATTLLNEYNLLSDEYNSLLPDTPYVLEHMLEITRRAQQEYGAQ